MVRTQIQFEPEQYSFIKKEAADRGISISHYLRLLVDSKHSAMPKTTANLEGIAGIFSSSNGISDVSENIDKYLAEAVEQEYLRKTGRA